MENRNLVLQQPQQQYGICLTCYAAGLRVSEVVALKVRDIDSDRMMIHVRQGKGKKDWMVPLSKTQL